MKQDIETIKNFLQREAVESENEGQYMLRANSKLKQILHDAASDSFDVAAVQTIRSFVETDKVSKRRLLAYCANFVDPTSSHTQTNARDTQVCLHTYLQKSELYKLVDFINLHRHDTTFGEAVYNLMNQHGMTAPQVYKNAMLRRQDFARATAFEGDYNVTKRVAWQIIIGLHCNLQEADAVLFSAGYLRRKNDVDLIMEYFISRENYDIAAINAVLSDLQLKEFPCYEPNRRGDPSLK